MRARHHLKSVPSVVVKGSPSSSQPPMQALKSPNGRSRVLAPRRGDSQGWRNWVRWLSSAGSYQGPASTSATRRPAWASRQVAMPPPAPEPTTMASYVS